MRRLVCILCLLTLGVAEAELVTYQFSGAVDWVEHMGFTETYIGQPFSGWFRYSSDSPFTETGAIAFTIGSFQSPVVDDRLYIDVPALNSNTSYFLYFDREYFSIVRLCFFDGPLDRAPLATDISLAMCSSVEFRVQIEETLDGMPMHLGIAGQVDTLERIPEPATVALLSLGGLLLRRCRKNAVC